MGGWEVGGFGVQALVATIAGDRQIVMRGTEWSQSRTNYAPAKTRTSR